MKRAQTRVVNGDQFADASWGSKKQMLIIIHGERLGLKIDLVSDAGPFTIGRSPDAHYIVQDDITSWMHCRIFNERANWFLEDLQSTNGTFLDVTQILGRIKLQNGDCFKVGQTIFKFLSTSELEASYYQEIYHLAVSDGLTLLPNRRVFSEVLEREFARSQRHQRPLSLVIFDIDKFKSINDTYGHLCGDMALRAIADTFRVRIRKEDLFARYAGDEFVWLLTETPEGFALKFAWWLVETCRKIQLNFQDSTISLSLSAGVASYQANQKAPEDLINAADQALYRAKEKGRNCASS